MPGWRFGAGSYDVENMEKCENGCGVPSVSNGDSAGPGGARPVRVLLVDDDRINRELALRMLMHLGIRADPVASGAAAIDAARAGDYDVVFMDLNMPGMDGIEATRRILELNLARPPRIVALTANVADETRERCLGSGMSDFITKPYVIADLRRALSAAGGGA